MIRGHPDSSAARSGAGEHGQRRTRVVFSIDNLDVGGTELNAVRTAERLDRARFDVRVAALQNDGPLLARYREAGIPVHGFPIASLYGWSALRQGLRLARFLRRNRTDVFHAHDIYSNIFGVPIARLAGVPRVLASRRWWVGPARWPHRLANRLAYRLAHTVVANAPRVAELVRSEGVDAGRVRVVPNFIEEELFEQCDEAERAAGLARFGIKPAATVIGCVANLTPVKGHDVLLRSAARLADEWPDMEILLIGDGPRLAALQEIATRLGMARRVHFAGRRPNGGRLQRLFDIAVLASDSEGQSNALLEAMAAAVPVVATAVGGNRDLIEHDFSGVLVPPRDDKAMASALHSLLRDAKRRHRLGQTARRVIRERYSAASALQQLSALYVGPQLGIRA